VTKGIDVVVGTSIDDTHARILQALSEPVVGPEKRSRSPEIGISATPGPTCQDLVITKIEFGLCWCVESEEDDILGGRSTVVAAQQAMLFVRNEVIFQYERALTLLARGRFQEATAVAQVLERARGQPFGRDVNPAFNNKVMTVLIDSVARIAHAVCTMNTCRDREVCRKNCKATSAKRLLCSVRWRSS
jgi:hypothetical protein